jgi:hypothetical protein
MATDQKLISSLLDLSRNVDKLSGDIKKNTATTSDLAEVQTKSAGDTKDLGKIAESIKGLDLGSLKGEFSQLTKSIGGLDFQGLSKDLKSLDFKGLTQGIKGLDFKSLSQDLKKLDFKDLAGSIKGLDLKGISGAAKGPDIGGIAGAVKEGGIKNVVSGSLGGLAKGFGKNLLGGFEAGGKVEKTGNYLVGEKGPEIVNLNKGAAVIPNFILRERQEILKKLGKNAPSEKEIDISRKEVMASNPEYYGREGDGSTHLESELNYYLEDKYGEPVQTFSPADLKKLTEPTVKKDEAVVSPVNKAPKATEVKNEAKNEAKVKEKKDGLFSKIFGKKKDDNIKEEEKPKEEKPRGPSIFDKGKELLKSVDTGSIVKNAENLINNPTDLLKSAGGIGMQTMLKKKEEPKPAEIKNTVNKLSKLPEPKQSAKTAPAPTPTTEPTNKMPPVTNESDNKKAETKTSTTSSSGSTTASSGAEGLNKDDVTEMKSILMRIASLLEGPLSVSSIDAPYRPDSRRV